jgi:hypothetical protein
VVAALDALGELDLLGRGQEGDLADVLEEELERVGRDLARLGLEVEPGRLVGVVDDLDRELLERRVELVQLHGLELVAERERDLLVREEAGLLALAHERSGVLMVEHDAHLAPLPLLELPYPVSST